MKKVNTLRNQFHSIDKRKFLVSLVIFALLASSLLSSSFKAANASPAAQITLTPNPATYDQNIQISGANFNPNAQVIVTWSNLSLWQVSTTTTSIGSFVLTVGVPQGLGAGNYTITATDQTNVAQANFTLNAVFAPPTGSTSGTFGIKTQDQYVSWVFNSNSFYCDVWQFFQNSINGWYSVLNHNYGEYVLRLTYKNVTYVYDLAGGKFNAYPTPLVESGVSFSVVNPTQIHGTMQIYDPTNSVLLLTINMDVYTPSTPQNYYSVVFTLKSASAKLDNVALYAAQNLNVWTSSPSSAYYNNVTDSVYQYYGSSLYATLYPSPGLLDIPEQYTGFAGFSSVSTASTHHDAALYYTDVQNVAGLMGYNFNYRDRNQAIGDSFGDCGIGLQWNIGSLNSQSSFQIPIAYATSGSDLATLNSNLQNGKMLVYSNVPALTLDKTQGSGLSLTNVTGTGFIPYSTINLQFNNLLGQTLQANSSGAFQASILIPTTISGTYSITASDGQGLKATALFTVTESASPSWANDITSTLDSIDANLAGVNGNIATINTNLGVIQTSLSALNASIQVLNSTTIQIQSSIGTVTQNVTNMNSFLTGINATVIGVQNQNNAAFVSLNSTLGLLSAKLDVLNATLMGVQGNTVSIQTSLGTLSAKLDVLNATLMGVQGNTVALQTSLGTLETNVSDINSHLTITDGNIATIQTEFGTISGNITSIQGDIATIKTNIGTMTIKTTQNNAIMSTFLVGIGLAVAVSLLMLILWFRPRNLYSKFKPNSKISYPSVATPTTPDEAVPSGTQEFSEPKENENTFEDLNLLGMDHLNEENAFDGSFSNQAQANAESSIPESNISCPACGKTLNGPPTIKLDFSEGEARLINVCPYCDHVLGEAPEPEEVIQENDKTNA